MKRRTAPYIHNRCDGSGLPAGDDARGTGTALGNACPCCSAVLDPDRFGNFPTHKAE